VPRGSGAGKERTLLTLVTDGSGGDLIALARTAAREGIDHFQIRERQLSDRVLSSRVRSVVVATAGSRLRVLVNGRPDVAAICGAHGVQLPEEGLPVGAVRKAFPSLLIGSSRHSLEGALAAEGEGADFVMLGPIFGSPGKEARALGLAALAEAARALGVPLHAIGGIDAASGPQAVKAGAAGLAAIRFFHEGSLAEAVRALRGESG
jgi:thiamine-phosphate diphosphorylase